MRRFLALTAVVIIGLCLAGAFASQGSAVPVESGKLPLSLQRLMENPVIHVKKHCKEGKCLGCTQYCDHWKHSDYCKEHHDDPSCCKDWDKHCVCVPCLDGAAQ